MSIFICLECSKRFSSPRTANAAMRNGCPKCGGVDIDLDVPGFKPKAQSEISEAREHFSAAGGTGRWEQD